MTMEYQAFAIDEIKADEDSYTFAGFASVFNNVDSQKVVVLPGAFTRTIKDRKADDVRLLSVGSDPDGGYVVTPQMSAEMTKIDYETSPIRQIAAVETISTDALDDVDEAAGSWVGETSSRSETDSPQFGKRNIPTHELYAQPKATQKLIDDASVDIERWLTEKVADIFSRKQNTAFVSGTGINQPRGFLTYAAGTAWGQIEQIASGNASAITADGLITLFYSLKSEYTRNASFLMNRTTVGAARKLKQGSGPFLGGNLGQRTEFRGRGRAAPLRSRLVMLAVWLRVK